MSIIQNDNATVYSTSQTEIVDFKSEVNTMKLTSRWRINRDCVNDMQCCIGLHLTINKTGNCFVETGNFQVIGLHDYFGTTVIHNIYQ